MHELSIATNIIEIVEKEAKKSAAKRITSITLQIGTFSGIVGECLEFVFPVVAKDTLAENAKLKIKKIPLTISCRKCNQNLKVKNYILICPLCKNTTVDIISGRELNIEKIEVE